MKPSPAWDNYRKQMAIHMKTGDFTKPWEWSTVVATMYVGAGEVVKRELQEIKAAGVQAGSTWDDADAHNLINQRYHLLQWEKANPGLDITKFKTILEVGAGYGAMVILFSRLGFRGKYYIVDLPELEQVQRQHLAWRGIKCRTKWGEYRRPDLLIGIASLGEIPLEDRVEFMERMRPKAYMLAYVGSYDGVDNQAFFKEWAENLKRQGGPSYLSFGDPNSLDYLISVQLP